MPIDWLVRSLHIKILTIRGKPIAITDRSIHEPEVLTTASSATPSQDDDEEVMSPPVSTEPEVDETNNSNLEAVIDNEDFLDPLNREEDREEDVEGQATERYHEEGGLGDDSEAMEVDTASRIDARANGQVGLLIDVIVVVLGAYWLQKGAQGLIRSGVIAQGALLDQGLTRKRKASKSPPRAGPPRPAQNHITDSETQTPTTATSQATGPTGKRLKRSYGFYEPLSSSDRSNVMHGKLFYSVLCSGIGNNTLFVRRVGAAPVQK